MLKTHYMKFPNFSRLKYFFRYLTTFWRAIKFRDFQNSLKKAIVDQKIDKVIAMSVIAKDIRKALRIDAHSKYIPDDHKNREEIKMMILLRHGEKMKFLNIQVTDDLKLI
jgi:hypothetical protein